MGRRGARPTCAIRRVRSRDIGAVKGVERGELGAGFLRLFWVGFVRGILIAEALT